MDVHAIDHLELYVEDAEETAAHLRDAYGFTVRGRGGPDTGLGNCRTVLLRQRDIALLVTSALPGGHPAGEYVDRHGDGVAVIGLEVDDADAAFSEAVERGAVPTAPPTVLGAAGNRVAFASVLGFGDVEHRFTSREARGAPFAPGLIEESGPAAPARTALFETVDHIAVCLPAGELEHAVRHYQEVFGFAQTFEERIVVGHQAMDSKVVQSASEKVTLTLIEPDITRELGQIDAFVSAHGGAGVQHVAFLTGDITRAVRSASDRGARFLSTPAAYYDTLTERVGDLSVPVAELRELNVLADRDSSGAMFQIFSESRHPRRTLFYELIERRGARTFGSNNIKALYEAVERQHALSDSTAPSA
ncbi:4-hydroxyphenylpyruvate dioxygenase [Streptomyces sp. NPDC050617]|uniref:4-hydroxyphenylpyruvate dioxygenase n=1 Tax=Streptomyces sp. NPDC050617 TaxID=3154628 RepID=UPI00341FE296